MPDCTCDLSRCVSCDEVRDAELRRTFPSAVPMCAACGLPGHRYGRNEGMERFDPMACINQLRGVLEREIHRA